MAKKEETKETKDKVVKETKKKEKKQESTKSDKKDKKESSKDIKDANGASKEKEDKPEIKHFVRVANTDLDGHKNAQYGLTKISGIGRRVAKIIASQINSRKQLGYLEDEDVRKLQTSIDSISSILPSWMINKQHEIMSGENRHLIGTDVILGTNEDLNVMKKMRSYKGLRHEKGLRVRGQRTRSTGRRGKTVGVSRSSLMSKPKEAEKKEDTKGTGKVAGKGAGK